MCNNQDIATSKNAERVQESGKTIELEKLKEAKLKLESRQTELQHQLIGVDLNEIEQKSKGHKEILHQLNDTKDLGYYLMGLLAKCQQSSIKEIASRFDIEE